jgi:uncharacterized protein YeaO (DUF488 family)
MTATIQLKRVYEPLSEEDGARFLVERLWPRGMRKSALADAQWTKDAAPSTELREWFHHDPERWQEFRKRYFSELKSRSDGLMPIVEAARKGKVTLLYSSHDKQHNNALALKEYIGRHFFKSASTG